MYQIEKPQYYSTFKSSQFIRSAKVISNAKFNITILIEVAL